VYVPGLEKSFSETTGAALIAVATAEKFALISDDFIVPPDENEFGIVT
jgi:hypothetical protein